jgi:sugar phosphate isomerase/epimerase
MRLGCAAYSYRDYLQKGQMTLEELVVQCRMMGLDGVELTAYYFPSTEREALHALKRHCFRQGMHILATAVGSNFAQADADKRRKDVQMTKEWIDHSVVLGAPCIRVFAGPIPAGHTELEALRWAVECLQECVAYGAERGVVVALENHGGITATAGQVLRLVELLNGPWFGLNLDFGNFRNDPYEEIRQCAPYAVTTHAKRTMHGGSEPVRIDYAQVLKIMCAVDYHGYLSIEYEDADDPRQAVPEFVQSLKECLG